MWRYHEQGDTASDQLRSTAQSVGNELFERCLEVLYIGSESIHQLPRPMLIEEGDILQHNLLEQILTHSGRHLLPHATEQIDVHEGECRLQQVQAEQIAGRLADILHKRIVYGIHDVCVGIAGQCVNQIPQQIGYAYVDECNN